MEPEQNIMNLSAVKGESNIKTSDSKETFHAYLLPWPTYLFAKKIVVAVDKDTISLAHKSSGKEVFACPIDRLGLGQTQSVNFILLSDGNNTVRIMFSNPRWALAMALSMVFIFLSYIVKFGLPPLGFVLLLALAAPFHIWFNSKEASHPERKKFQDTLAQRVKNNVETYDRNVVDKQAQKITKVGFNVQNFILAAIFAGLTSVFGTIFFMVVTTSQSSNDKVVYPLIVINFVLLLIYFYKIFNRFNEEWFKKHEGGPNKLTKYAILACLPFAVIIFVPLILAIFMTPST